MKFLNYLYAASIVIILVIYAVTRINIVWLVGYLIILLATNLVQKKIFIQVVTAFAILAITVYVASIGSLSIAALLTAFLMVSTGLPGIISYAFVVFANFFLIKSPLLSSTIGVVPYYILVLLIILHLVKHFSDKLLKAIWFIPVIDLAPLIFDIAITFIMSFLIFTHIAQLYPAVQSIVAYVLGK